MSASEYQGFLESEVGEPEPADCLFHVIPAGYEKTVSYGTGTSMGPKSIIRASQQLEVFDGYGIPSKRGIFTYPPLDCNAAPEKIISDISTYVARSVSENKIPVLLGGEHSVSVGAFVGMKNTEMPVGIVQFDAHADLRDTYNGSKYSHACVMHRAVEFGFPVFQIGVRSLSPNEVDFRIQKNIPHLDAQDIAKNGIPEFLLPDDFPELIYITFDVDGLDPSVIQATGTPEPGGLSWYQAMEILETVMKGRTVIGFDVVELAPVPGHHASDFAAARLVYNIMGLIDRNQPLV
jgi:agmatinase